MSAFDELKNKAAGLAEQAKEALETVSETVIEKAGDAADAVTGGKFADTIDSIQAKAHDVLGSDKEGEDKQG
jgi:hypothetical protein